MEIDAGEPELPAEPGPRLARALAEQDAAAAKQARIRRAVGLSLLVIGLLVAGLAARSVLTGNDETEQKVGKLTASNLGAKAGTSAPPKGGSSTRVSSATTPPKSGSSGSGGSTGTSGTSSSSGSSGEAGAAAWPPALSGRPPALGRQGEPPPADAGDLEDGYYLWQDFQGWHLWLVGGGNDDKVTITADSEVAKADPAGEPVTIDRSANAFTFSRGPAGADVVGVDFNPGYYAKTFVVTVDSDLDLHIGARRWKAPAFYGVQKSTANA